MEIKMGFTEGGRWQARTAELCRVKTTLIYILSSVIAEKQSSVSTFWYI
jgi:hypothetical protein